MAIQKDFYQKFCNVGPGCQNDGTAMSGTAGESNLIYMDDKLWEEFVIGTQTITTPTVNATGIDWTLDDGAAGGDGWALTPLGHHINAPLVYTIGTDPAFFCRLKVQVTDWSGCKLSVGFHGGAATVQAHQGTWANYTDKACIEQHAGGAVDVYTSTALNNAGDVDTDTLINLTDGDVADFRVYVSAAGVVTYGLWIAPTATPTVFTEQTLTVAAYTFDDGDIVLPLIYMVDHTDRAANVILKEFWCGYQANI
jgi:hypothetical protein